MSPLSPSRIVCAANRIRETNVVILGARHWDQLMHTQAKAWLCGDYAERYVWEQGFIDQHGRFFDRQQAWAIAAANNQILRRVGGDAINGGTLFSENLY